MNKSLLIGIFFLLSLSVYANTQYAIKNGQWTNKNVWNTNTIPINGDTIIISNAYEIKIQHPLLYSNIILLISDSGIINITSNISSA